MKLKTILINLSILILLVSLTYAGILGSRNVKLSEERKIEIDKLGLTYTNTICQEVGTDNEHCFSCLHRAGSLQDEGCVTIMRRYCKAYGGTGEEEICTEYANYTNEEMKAFIIENQNREIEKIADKIINDKLKVPDTKIDEGGIIIIKEKKDG